MARLLSDKNEFCKVENMNGTCSDNKEIRKGTKLVSSKKYTKDELDIIYSNKEDKLFDYDEESGCLVIKKGYKTSSVKSIVSAKEYESFLQIYDFVDDLDITEDYQEVLCCRFKDMPYGIKSIFNQHISSLSCADTNTKVSRFVGLTNEIFINQFSDLKNVLGPGNEFMHELAHGLAHRLVCKHILSDTYDDDLAQCIIIDYDNAIQSIMKQYNMSFSDAQLEMKKILQENALASNIVSDVFGGVSHNVVVGAFWHDNETYWSKRNRDALGREFFAEMIADIACHNYCHIEFTNKYLPLTMLQFEKILKGVIFHGQQ